MIDKCVNCKERPEIISGDGMEYPYILAHKSDSTCYPSYRLIAHGESEKQCELVWNKFNEANRSKP